jgi:MFS transporter, FHS family, glucose/mannose:H+ symporter
MNPLLTASQQVSRPFILLIHFSFMLIGIGTIQLGVILPALAARLALDDEQSGALSFGQYAGSITGTFLTSFLWRRFGFVPSFAGGLLLMSAGTLGICLAEGWAATVLFIFLNGVGIGLTIPTANLMTANLNPHKSAAALNILNFTWGIGALLCPSFYGLLGTLENVNRPLFIFAAILFAAALSFVPFFQMTIGKESAQSAENPKSKIENPQAIWLTSFALLSVGVLFLYVGVENSLAYWLTTYALRLNAGENSLFTAVMSVFWTTFLLGRLCAPLFLRKLRETTFLLVSLSTAALGFLIILSAANQTVLAVGAALAGAGLAPTFPTVLAQFTTRFGAAAQSQVKWLFIISTAGGAALTWLIGYISKTSGDLRNGLFAGLAGCLLMIALIILLMRESKKSLT